MITERASALRDAAREVAPAAVAWRRALHAHPEPAYAERQTAALVAGALEDLGLEVRAGVGGTTGVVGLLRGTGPHRGGRGKVVAIRADMDALPIPGADPKDVPYRTQAEG